MRKISIVLEDTGDGFVASVFNKPELHGEGSVPSVALYNLAKVVEYVGLDEMFTRQASEPAGGTLMETLVEPAGPDGWQSLNLTEMERVRSGEKLMACKMIKERLGIGLKEAKDIIDSYCARIAHGG